MSQEAEKEGEGKAAGGDKGGGGQMKLVVMVAVAAFVAVLGGQVAGPFINGAIHGPAPAAGKGEDDHSGADEHAAEEEHKPEAIEPAEYTPLDPPFVVSFDQEDGTRYLQLTLQAMARSEEKISAIKQHAPAVRNSFLFLLSGYKLDDLKTQEGKEALRAAMLASAKEILKKNTGEEQIEDLYFTSLVIQ
jgi:flagellar FliL protein